MGTIIRPYAFQTAVPFSYRNFQRVSELCEVRDLEVELANLLVTKFRNLPARRTAFVSHTQDLYQFL